MKRFSLIIASIVGSAWANPQLPQMSDKTEWLGYFVGWESKGADFGIGSDGEALFHPKQNRKRAGHKSIGLRYLIQEKKDGRWVGRKFLPEGGLTSDAKSGIDPQGPVKLVTTVTGGTKVEWTHVVKNGKVSILPKILEKGGENEIRVGVRFALPKLYATNKQDLEGKELKELVKGDTLTGKRLKDGKKKRIKFEDVKEDPSSDDYFKEGASEIAVKSKGLMKQTFSVSIGGQGSGELFVNPRGPLHKSFGIEWFAKPEKVGQRDSYVTFEMD